VTRLAQRLKNRLSVRRKKAARGRFNVKETLRKNLQYGGVPFQIQIDRRKKTKPQVMILCDISDSVLNASRFMLQFVYSVQVLYAKVRSFVFVSDLGEVTKLFEENEIHHAVETALKGDVIDVFSHSNFGRAFEKFYKNYFSAVTGKTTVLIIGDGRNNYNRSNEWVLGRVDYVPTESIENADLILLNTCSVRDKAEQKVYSSLGRWKELKEQREGVVIGVGGCLAQQEGERLLKRVPHLDLVFGTHNIHKLPEMVEQVQTWRTRPAETAFYRDPSYMEDAECRTHVQGSKAFVTIMQGCNKVCSFCIVPHVRGR